MLEVDLRRKKRHTCTFESSDLLAVVLAVLIDLPDAVLQLTDFSCHLSDEEQEKEGNIKVSTAKGFVPIRSTSKIKAPVVQH